jgi:hypothetical protein
MNPERDNGDQPGYDSSEDALLEAGDLFDPRVLRHVLRVAANAEELTSHPLIPLAMASARRLGEIYPQTPIGHSLALRSLLRHAVETLRPEPGAPDYGNSSWYPYIILYQQFLRRVTVEALAHQMTCAGKPMTRSTWRPTSTPLGV